MGLFAPHSKAVPVDPAKPVTPRPVAMTWAQRLKRVFGIEVNTCSGCGGAGLLALGAEQAGMEGNAGALPNGSTRLAG